MELDIEQNEIKIEFINYIYLYSLIQDFVTFSCNIYKIEKPKNIYIYMIIIKKKNLDLIYAKKHLIKKHK